MKKQIAAFLAATLLAASFLLPVAAADAPAVHASDELNYSTVARGGYVYTAVKGPLERIDPATGNRQTIVPKSKEYDLRDFSMQGGFVYWPGGKAIYKCKEDGTGLTKLDAGGKATGLRVVGDKLFFLSGSALTAMKTDGTARRKLVDGADRFEPAGGFLYYTQSDGEMLLRCDADGGNVTELTPLDGEWEPQVNGSALCFPVGKEWYVTTADGRAKRTYGAPNRIRVGYSVYKFPTGMGPDMKYKAYGTRVLETKTKKSFSLPDTDEFSWFSTAEYFYFSQSQEDAGLYRVGWDGKNKKKLADSGEPILLAGNYLVYRTGSDIAFAKE